MDSVGCEVYFHFKNAFSSPEKNSFLITWEVSCHLLQLYPTRDIPQERNPEWQRYSRQELPAKNLCTSMTPGTFCLPSLLSAHYSTPLPEALDQGETSVWDKLVRYREAEHLPLNSQISLSLPLWSVALRVSDMTSPVANCYWKHH